MQGQRGTPTLVAFTSLTSHALKNEKKKPSNLSICNSFTEGYSIRKCSKSRRGPVSMDVEHPLKAAGPY